MANIDELKRLGERFPNKNVGCGNPDAKILVVTQKVGNEKVDYRYLRKLFQELPEITGKEIDVLDLCYYVVFDKELLKDSFFEHFRVILYTFINGNQLNQYDPAVLFDMKWVPECTVEDGAIQRLFVAHSRAENDKPERIMLCTYPFEKVSFVVRKCSMALMDWFFYKNIEK